jgi:hypothetical protein
MKCNGCAREIPDGELRMSLHYQLERAHDDVVTIDQSDSLLITCIDCSPSRRAIGDALRDTGLPIPHEV